MGDVNQRLKRFVDNPQAFRSQMALNDALISGSFVLQFLDVVLWKESDIDVFIKDGPNAIAFGRYLLSSEGYQVDSERLFYYGHAPGSILKVGHGFSSAIPQK